MALVPFPGATPSVARDRDPDDSTSLFGDDDDAAGKMSFLEHLDELRKRLIYSVISLCVGCAIAYIFINRIVDFIMLPLVHMLPGGNKLMFTNGPDASCCT